MRSFFRPSTPFALLALLIAGAPQAAAQDLGATLAARQQALPKQKTAYLETFLNAPPGGASAEKDLKLAAKVAVAQEAPRERIEIQPVSGNTFGETVIVVGNGKDYFLVTKVGSTPLAKSAKAQDALVLQALGSAPNETAKKRALKTSDGKLAAVIYREPRPADFNSSTAFSLEAPKLGGGLLKKGLSSFADSDQPVVTASAGARGVDEIDTPDGKMPVTPDSSAVVWLEEREVSPLDLEAFLVAGRLGPYAGTEEAQ
ncbi:MAG TPA: hypothetical protein VIC59_13030 [Gemmatimonadota bacterium]|jgi:hypothetical protein